MELLNLHCSCGVSFVGQGHESMATAWREAWASFHSGPGHEPTSTAAIAGRQRDAAAAARGWEPARW